MFIIRHTHTNPRQHERWALWRNFHNEYASKGKYQSTWRQSFTQWMRSYTVSVKIPGLLPPNLHVVCMVEVRNACNVIAWKRVGTWQLGVDWNIIVKCIFKKYGLRMWSGVWCTIRICASGRFLWMNLKNFLTSWATVGLLRTLCFMKLDTPDLVMKPKALQLSLWSGVWTCLCTERTRVWFVLNIFYSYYNLKLPEGGIF
jgi:hypothetical protein